MGLISVFSLVKNVQNSVLYYTFHLGHVTNAVSFWSILALSLVVTCLCSTCSLFLTHLDSAHSMTRPQGLPQNRCFHSNGARLDYGMAVLNGVMAMFTVIWSLT
uniref:Uncharacterized protein n=1 Tax=Neogobius melanostomus TaxID=47308 RepID=A0A8C6U0Z1_9GOBI